MPQESLNENNQLKSIEYAMLMSQVDPSKVHFFDESSVKRTTGNRIYGHAKRGKRAVEVKRYTRPIVTILLIYCKADLA